jgi:hypothetical protein
LDFDENVTNVEIEKDCKKALIERLA